LQLNIKKIVSLDELQLCISIPSDVGGWAYSGPSDMNCFLVAALDKLDKV